MAISNSKRCVHQQSRGKSKNEFIADTFDPFQQRPVNPDDGLLWWKVPNLKFEDLFDWKLDVFKVDSVATAYCGILGASPHFHKMDECTRAGLVSLFTGPPEVFGSAAENFQAQQLGKKKHRKFLVDINGLQIGFFRYGNEVYAVENRCPHLQGPLALGDIEEVDGHLCVNCPYHHWRFELKTGQLWQPNRPDVKNANVFPLRIRKSELFVGFTHFCPSTFTDFSF